MLFLLDTSAVSRLMREDPRMAEWLTAVADRDSVLTCTIVRGEVLFGIEKLEPGLRRAQLEAKFERVMTALRCEPVPATAAEHYAKVKVTQQHRGLTLDENDLWIAATALALDATLVTADSDFQRVDAIRVRIP